MWIRYRDRWSSGSGDWDYREIGSKDDVECIKEELDSNNSWSEHYRGCDIEIIPHPPLSVLNAKRDRAERNAEYYKKKAIELATEYNEAITNEYFSHSVFKFNDDGETKLAVQLTEKDWGGNTETVGYYSRYFEYFFEKHGEKETLRDEMLNFFNNRPSRNDYDEDTFEKTLDKVIALVYD